MHQGIYYPFTARKTMQLVPSKKSDTMIFDGFAPKAQKQLGLRGVLKVQQFLNQP